MKLRITGTPIECAAAVQALAAGFVLREVSEFYPNRGTTVLGRVYVDAEPQPDGASRGPVGRVDAGPFGTDELAERGALAARLSGIDASLVVRTARREWDCTCATGRNYLPSCTGEPIARGEVHVEYLGEAAAYSCGTRYHAACAVTAWTGPRSGPPGMVDLDGITGSGSAR